MPPKKKAKLYSTLSDTKNGLENDSEVCFSDRNQITKYWLFKSEPESRFEKGVDLKFGIEDLKISPNQTSCWYGVRNYQARNYMRDQMRVGDKGFFYHSNCKDPGIAGIVEVVRESYPDHTQFDKASPFYDPKATRDNPRWFMVDVKYNAMLKAYLSLKQLKAIHQEHKVTGGPLKSLKLFTSARLSVQPVMKDEFEYILSLADASISCNQ